ncbi:MAG: DNA-binding protein [Fimbriimonadales bacterium]
MAEKKSFLLRISPELWDDLQRMASAELRSVNGQIEFLLREALKARGRKLPPPAEEERALAEE